MPTRGVSIKALHSMNDLILMMLLCYNLFKNKVIINNINIVIIIIIIIIKTIIIIVIVIIITLLLSLLSLLSLLEGRMFVMITDFEISNISFNF